MKTLTISKNFSQYFYNAVRPVAAIHIGESKN
jgi:hypothetical protein